MGKHKKKITHKKKHKKEKKYKERKCKCHRKSSSSSDGDTSTSSGSCGRDKETKDFMIKNTDAIQDEIGWNYLFSERHAMPRQKSEPRNERYTLDKPGQSIRELNPYWKDGGDGLPSTNKNTSVMFEKNPDIKSINKLIEKSKDIVNFTGAPSDEIKEEWGHLKKLKQVIQVSENECTDDSSRRSIQPQTNLRAARNKMVTESNSGKLNFMKPGEGLYSNFMGTSKQNWRKKTEKEYEAAEQLADCSKSSKDADEAMSCKEKISLLTADELNALAAKKIKAQIMGNKTLAEKLERDIENAKRNRREHAAAGESKPECKEEAVVVLKKDILEKIRKPRGSDRNVGERSRKRERGETHKGNERLRYFMNDDKHSLKSMFEREKIGATEQSYELHLDLAKKGKFGSNSDDYDLDDVFLDRVRCSDFERKEGDRERNTAVKKAKTEHKILSRCRWCLDGNNVQKHLIISIGVKCYLCLPSDKSLTDGHCLIVPVHHDTCGTLLDEDAWNEMVSYRNRLCRMFEDAGQSVVFFENARSFNRFPHMILHCVPMDKEIGDLAPIYFKKAIMESETEWSDNQKLIDLRNKDLRRSVPKGLPYFTIDFGRDGGFAHVIEDEKLFPANFAEEIIGGMLDLDAVKWRRREKESLEYQKEKAKEFLARWKNYEDRECENRPESG